MFVYGREADAEGKINLYLQTNSKSALLSALSIGEAEGLFL